MRSAPWHVTGTRTRNVIELLGWRRSSICKHSTPVIHYALDCMSEGATRKKRLSIIDRDKSREIDTRNEQKRPRKRCNRMQFLASCLEALEAMLVPKHPQRLGLQCALMFTHSMNGAKGSEREENRSMHRITPDFVRQPRDGPVGAARKLSPMSHRSIFNSLGCSFTSTTGFIHISSRHQP